MKKHYKILALLIIVAGPVSAGQYAVQLEASKSPQLERYKQLSVHGELYTVAADNGYIRTRLGPYDSKAAALAVLEQVHEAGYADAFLAKYNSGGITAGSSVASSASRHQYDVENFDVRSLPEWGNLTPEQQSNIVYLDGVLHVKNGDEFIPMEELVSQ